MTCRRLNKSALERSPHALLLCVVAVGSLLSGTSLAVNASPYQMAAFVGKDKTEKLSFDIAPQPLLSALKKYSEVTGQAVLVDEAMTVGVHSEGVHGDFNNVDALLKILMGTGLTASYSSDQAFTLKAIDPGIHVGPNGSFDPKNDADDSSETAIDRYAAKIQKPIESALCRFPETRPGNYRLALQLWIMPNGQVTKTLILSDATEARKTQIQLTLNQLTLDAPPPTMPEPLTVLLTPRSGASHFRCASTNHAAP